MKKGILLCFIAINILVISAKHKCTHDSAENTKYYDELYNNYEKLEKTNHDVRML